MYHIQKQTRLYNGEPYCGYTSKGCRAEYKTFEEAKDAVKQLAKSNPGVGWNIFDAESRELLDGFDFFSGFEDY